MSELEDVAAVQEAQPRTPGEKALVEARKHLGLKEYPAGSNRTPFGRWFGADGAPWCAIFVSFCFKVGAGVVLCQGSTGPGVAPNGCAYVPTIEAWLRSTGQWLGRRVPRAGDIAVFNWGGGEPDHIGVVERCLPDGRFWTIEGNTGVGNNADGGEVMRRVRAPADVDGFGRIRAIAGGSDGDTLDVST